MPENSQSTPLTYQPAVKGYSFKSNLPHLPAEPEQKIEQSEIQRQQDKTPPKGTNPLLLLALEIFGLTAIFIIFLLILNFFKVISLQNTVPTQVSQSIASYNAKTGLWTAQGTFSGYDEYTVKIKIGVITENFQWTEDKSNASFYNSEADLANTKYAPIIYSLFDLEQTQNLGKKVIIQYKTTNNQKTIENLKIFAP